MQKTNPNLFMARKRKAGTLPVSKPNRHRVADASNATSRSSPTMDERMELTKGGRKHKELIWTAIFAGREAINNLWRRVGVSLNL